MRRDHKSDVKPTITLAWPDRRLHPNARPHWAQRGKAAKAARAEGCLLALAAGWHNVTWPDGRLHLWIDFFPPDQRRRDDDGLLSSVKPHRDGIADALGIDDSRFVSHPYLRDETYPGGKVVMQITGGPDRE